MEKQLTDTDLIKNNHNSVSSQPVDRYIGQFFFKKVVHEICVFFLGVICCAGPAAKTDLGSGFFNIQLSAALQASGFYVIQDFYPLSLIVLWIK